jgi:flagellar basal-body rod modification protein FlgD
MDIAATTSISQGSLNQGVVASAKSELGMDDFFKLLTTQLVSQDPLKPMEDTEFISQMASFNSLSQMEIIAANTGASMEQQERTAVMGLIGKNVVGVGLNGEEISGIVDRAESVDGKLVPYIGLIEVPFLSIKSISSISSSPT